MYMENRLILTSQIIKQPEFIKRRQTYSRCRVWGFYLIGLDIHFFFLKLFSHLLSKRRPLSWELYKNIKRIMSAVCHIYNRKVFYRNTNHRVRKSNKIHLLAESICTPKNVIIKFHTWGKNKTSPLRSAFNTLLKFLCQLIKYLSCLPVISSLINAWWFFHHVMEHTCTSFLYYTR